MRARHGRKIRGAAQQRDAADEGRLEPCGSIIVGNEAIVNNGEAVRPSQLIASVGRAAGGEEQSRQAASVTPEVA